MLGWSGDTISGIDVIGLDNEWAKMLGLEDGQIVRKSCFKISDD